MSQTIEDIIKIYIKDGAPESTECFLCLQDSTTTWDFKSLLSSGLRTMQFQTFTWDEGKLVFYL